MGGYGSGGWQTGRRTVEQCVRIKASRMAFDLFSDGLALLKGIGWTFRNWEGEFKMHPSRRPDEDPFRMVNLEVFYRVDDFRPWGSVWACDVRMLGHATPLGGVRWLFVCPNCITERADLYCPPGKFRFFCRDCYKLAYASTQETKASLKPLGGLPISWRDAWRMLTTEKREEDLYNRRVEWRKYKEMCRRGRSGNSRKP